MPTALLDLSILSTDTRSRGIGRYLTDLGRALQTVSGSSNDLRVLGIERLHWFGKADVTEDISGAVARLSRPRARHTTHALWANRLRLALAPAARAVAPDLVHLGCAAATPIGELGCPRVTTCHDLIPLKYPERYLDWTDGFRAGREAVERRRFHSADHVIAVSEATANDLITLLGLAAKQITVVHNGVDLSRWSPEPEEGDPRVRTRHELGERSYVLYVGTADWHKNQEGMLAALDVARRRAPGLDLALAWAGWLSPQDQRELRRRARALGVSDALLLLGYVPDEELAALYRGAAAQLFVSRAEGFGYPMVEAMSAGCPVIASKRSGTLEISGDAALQVDPEDADGIADAIVTLADSEMERRRISARGVARAQRFSLQRMAEGTLGVYRDVMSRTRALAPHAARGGLA